MRWERVEVRFWAKVNKRADEQCWPWQGSKDQDGYGKFGCNFIRSHRMAYELTHGLIPTGMCVCHICDNPLCCNPAHLWLGTNAENTSDKVSKGRHPRGAVVVTAKLSPDDVKAIRSLNLSQGKIAEAFGIGQTQVSRIMSRESWANLG